MTEKRADPSTFELLRDTCKSFPKNSGVYLMKNVGEKIIYVGKAKDLRARVRSYFLDHDGVSSKTRFLMQNVRHIEYILTKTEVEAFLLEASLIKKHRPRYNIRLKDDKSYPYIRVSMADEFPRFYLARKVKKDGAQYFGPYSGGGVVMDTIRFLNTTFKIRDCNDGFMRSRTRPCITHEIGRCTAPCVNYVSEDEYAHDIKDALLFLRGRSRTIFKDLNQRMKEASKQERFELAARLRDSINSVEQVLRKQVVVNDTAQVDQDVIAYFGDEHGTLVEVLHLRQGRVIGSQPHFLPMLNAHDEGEDVREWLTSFFNQYYEENVIPDEVIVGADLGRDLNVLLRKVLKERSGRDVSVYYPSAQNAVKLLEMAEQNAQSHFRDHVSKSHQKLKGLEEIQKKLHLPALPLRIECYDISNFQGRETVASQVVFEEGVPNRDQYRRYKIKTVEGSNDFAAMAEVLARRFKHTEYDDPQLIVIDGGKGQLNTVLAVLKELGRPEIPVVGLAKARVQGDFQAEQVESTSERFFLPGRQNPVTFRSNSDALYILVGIRDEAHRFAITYHRKLREATTIESELDHVVGLGPKRKQELLKKFPSVEALKQASVEEVAKLRGFNRVLAERILLQIREGDTTDIEIEA